jgi:hypothetical protein
MHCGGSILEPSVPAGERELDAWSLCGPAQSTVHRACPRAWLGQSVDVTADAKLNPVRRNTVQPTFGQDKAFAPGLRLGTCENAKQQGEVTAR